MRIRTLLCVSLLSLGLFSGCSCSEQPEDIEVHTPSGKTYSFDDVDPREKGKEFTLSNENDLINFQEQVNNQNAEYVNGYFELNNDIQLTKEWVPVNNFKGQFNGNGYTISGFKMDTDKNKRGFFSAIDGAKVGCFTMNGDLKVGDSSAFISGTSLGDSTIVGVTIRGQMNSFNNIGGLIGSISEGSLKVVGCLNAATIKGKGYVGGLIGSNKTNKINISDSANFGLVEGSNDMVGGLIASLTHSTSQTNDYNIYQGFNYGTVKGSTYVGGVVGLSCAQLIQCGAGKDSHVYQLKDGEEIEAKTLTSFIAPYCSTLCGNLLYNTKINECGELIECQNQDGFAITGINDPAGCTRIIKFKDTVMLFTATNRQAISTDGGHTFGPFIVISSKADEKCPIDGEASTDTGNTQPWVLPDGRIAMFYRAIRKATSFSYGSLRMRISNADGVFNPGDEPITLIENYTSNTGTAGAFYEPYPILLDDGTIAIYISEDVHYTEAFDNGVYQVAPLRNDLICSGGSQDTVMIPLKVAENATTLENGIEIGDPVLIFQGSNTSMFGHENSRPGMTVITQLYDGSYAMILENSTEQHNPGYNLVIQITYSQDGRTWTAPKTIIRPHQEGGHRNGDGTLYKCCAPFITTLPDGRIFVVCATDEDYVGFFPTDDSHYKHEIGFISKNRVSYGDNLERDQDFIQVGNYSYSENEYCVWASVAFIDGTIYISGLEGVNYQKDDGTVGTPLQWVLLSTINYKTLYNNLGLTELN